MLTEFHISIFDQLNSCTDRATQRVLYTRLCESIGVHFRGIFLFSAEGSLDFRNTSLDESPLEEPKIGNWDYVDANFLEKPRENSEDREVLESFRSHGILNPELLPKEGDGMWIQGYEKEYSQKWLEKIAKRSLSIRFIQWWIGTPKPDQIDYGQYDIGYAESSQCEPYITCDELIKLIKIGGFIIIRQSNFDGRLISHPLQTQFRNRVRKVVTSVPEGGFDLFEKIR